MLQFFSFKNTEDVYAHLKSQKSKKIVSPNSIFFFYVHEKNLSLIVEHTGPNWPPIKLLGPSNVATVPPTSRFEFFLNHFSCSGCPSQRNFKLNVKKKELFNSFDCAQTNCFFFLRNYTMILHFFENLAASSFQVLYFSCSLQYV